MKITDKTPRQLPETYKSKDNMSVPGFYFQYRGETSMAEGPASRWTNAQNVEVMCRMEDRGLHVTVAQPRKFVRVEEAIVILREFFGDCPYTITLGASGNARIIDARETRREE